MHHSSLLLDSFNGFTALPLASLEVGQHLYWQIGGLKVHGQVLITSWIVIGILVIVSVLSTRKVERIPSGLQNFMEYALEFVRDLTKNQIGEKEYRPWVPFIGTLFLFIFVSNWSGALFPWKLISLPEGELAAPTNDINTTVALALCTSFVYFYAGFRKKDSVTFASTSNPLRYCSQLRFLKISPSRFPLVSVCLVTSLLTN